MATGNFFSNSTKLVNLEYVYQGLEKPDAGQFKPKSLIWDRETELWYKQVNGSWSAVTFDGSTGYLSASDLTNYLSSSDAVNFVSTSDIASFISASDTYTSATGVLTAVKTVDGTGSGLDADTVDGYEASALLGDGTANLTSYTSTSETLSSSNTGGVARFTNASAVTVTVPPTATASWSSGSTIGLMQGGAGTVTIAPGSGVTLQSYLSNTSIAGQYGTAALYYLGSDEWLLSGDLV